VRATICDHCNCLHVWLLDASDDVIAVAVMSVDVTERLIGEMQSGLDLLKPRNS
jgi:hypothetical protein